MEDSYTVHRRRKAAARKREKTPDPSTRGASRMDITDEEDEERRARMERMAEEAEKTEPRKEIGPVHQDAPKTPENGDKKKKNDREQDAVKRREKAEARKSVHVDDMIAIRAEVAAKSAGSNLKTRELDAATIGDTTRPVKQAVEVTNKSDDGLAKKETVETEAAQVKERKTVQEMSETPKEATGETVRTAEVRKVERRLKRRSKERAERYSRSTDSSDVEDKNETTSRRTKSPEVVRTRPKKTSSKSRAGDPETQKRDAERLNREKRSSSRQKLSDEPQSKEREKENEKEKEKKEKEERSIEKPLRSRPHSQAEDTDEDSKVMRKSESFPQKSTQERVVKRSSTDLKKQIIPLSNDSLIEDFARAQREYLLRERSIMDPEFTDVYQDASEGSLLRRRKFSLATTESEQHEETVQTVQPADVTETKESSWFSWLLFWRKKKDSEEIEEKKKVEEEEEEEEEKTVEDEPLKSAAKAEEIKAVKQEAPEKVTLLDFFRALRDGIGEFKAFAAQNTREVTVIRRMRNRCMAGLLLIIIYCGLGAFVFRFVEGSFETFYKCGVKRVKRDFLDSLWNYSHNMREDDWKSMARRKLMEFEEQLHTAHEAGVHSYSGQKSWSFLNAVGYCLTVITTIGYGHISPSTNTGKAITIVYAIFGIPMFLIILADFGKLFTRCIKFLWAFVRRLYYTGSCRKVRRTVPVQEVMKGVQLVYDLAKFRRPSQMNPEEIEEVQRQQQQQQQQQTVLNLDGNAPETPETPALSAFIIDDEFNLPISVAIFILLGYIFIGATLYYMWEDWSFFESFYFVFISMSTIGFGDYVPKHPIYMMCSIIYLVFGLALTSMCINVVQVMLSDSFNQASQKIGATIGFEVAEDDNSVKPASPPSIEIADVHMSTQESENGEKIAPKAKQEDVDL